MPFCPNDVAALAASERNCSIEIENYDLAATLTSGQAFRWRLEQGWWSGIIGQRWVRLQLENSILRAQVATPVKGWNWLRTYVQLDVAWPEIVATFPPDPALRQAVNYCR